MRLWSIHPRYLDQKGLTALWREALLARKVLEGRTKGYTRHPQLIRFRNCSDPIGAIEAYLEIVYKEACARGYHYDASKIHTIRYKGSIPVTNGQMAFEVSHLLMKLERRDRARFEELSGRNALEFEPSPIFSIREGEVESWEKTDVQTSN